MESRNKIISFHTVQNSWEAAAALVKNIDNIIDQEVEEAVALLKLPPIDDTMMYEAESESSESEDSDDEL